MQKTTSALCLSVPMAILHRFVTVSRGMASRDHKGCCWLYDVEMQSTVDAQLPCTCDLLHPVYFSLSQPQHQCTVLHWTHTQERQTCLNNTSAHSKKYQNCADWVTVQQACSFLCLGYILVGGGAFP